MRIGQLVKIERTRLRPVPEPHADGVMVIDETIGIYLGTHPQRMAMSYIMCPTGCGWVGIHHTELVILR